MKKLKISEREKAFADLLTLGWVNFDAYVVSGLYNPVYSREANQREMNALIEAPDFAAYLKLSGKRLRRKEKEEEESASADIDMATELSKEWVEIKKMIADITQAKKDEIQTEDTTIHYYLPLTCNMCELYRKYGKK